MSEQQLSPREVELKLELERIQQQNLELQSKINESAPVLDQIEKDRAEASFNSSLANAITSAGLEGSTALSQREFLNVIKGALKLEVGNDGSVYAVSESGRVLDFASTLQDYALKNEHLFEPRAVKRLKKPSSELSKSDMSQAQKVEYIRQHGQEKFEALPALPKRPMPSLATITRDEYMKLPTSERVAISKKVGEQGISEILRRR